MGWAIVLSLFLCPIITGVIAEKRGHIFFVWAVLEILSCAVACFVVFWGHRTAGVFAWISGASFMLSLPALLIYLPVPGATDMLTLDMPFPPEADDSPVISL